MTQIIKFLMISLLVLTLLHIYTIANAAQSIQDAVPMSDTMYPIQDGVFPSKNNSPDQPLSKNINDFNQKEEEQSSYIGKLGRKLKDLTVCALFGPEQFPFSFEFGLMFEFDEDIPIKENESKAKYYPTVPMFSSWENLAPLTDENEFEKRALKETYFPFHVLLATSIEENSDWCQGALIRSNWLITSKNCLDENFGLKSKKSVKVFLDAMNRENSGRILYSNVVLRKSIKDSPIMFEDDIFGFEDLALLKLDTLLETTEVTPVALTIPASDIVDEINCYFVTRCSDGIVRSMLYEMAGNATQSNLKFFKPGTLIVCNNGRLLNIKTASKSFYPLISALSWIDKNTLEEESDP